MCPNNKPYKILVRSPKGCIFDKLICVKCCATVLRGNYTAHKRTKKHKTLHDNQRKDDQNSQMQINSEIYKNKQIEKVSHYYENPN